MRFPRCLPGLLAWGFISVVEANTYVPYAFVADKFPPTNGAILAVWASPEDYAYGTPEDYLGATTTGVVYVAGTFTTVDGKPRNHVAAFNLITGELTNWNPDVDGPVHALAVRGGLVYLGGEFTTVGGQPRANLAAVKASTGNPSAWSPDPDGAVRVITVAGAGLYVGGAFSNVASQARSRLAAFHSGSLALLPWNPGADGNVLALTIVGRTLYAGGEFQMVAGAARPYAAAIDATSGAVSAWDPAANGPVRALLFEDSRIFAGGDFTVIGGHTRPYLAALNSVNGAALAWNPAPNGSVRALTFHSHMLYLGGDFTRVSGVVRSRLAAVDGRTGRLFHWNPGANGPVHALQFSFSGLDPVYPFDAGLLIGGAFTTLAGKTAAGLAGSFDDQWAGLPVATITRVNGQSWKNLPRERFGGPFNSPAYATTRSRIRLRGWAVAGDYSRGRRLLTTNKVTGSDEGDVSVERVFVSLGAKTFRAQGTTTWRANLRVRRGTTHIRVSAIDSLGRVSINVYQLGIQESDFSHLGLTRFTPANR